jgi:hypothetical protein
MMVTLLTGLAVGRVSRGDEGPFPRPSKDAIAKAEEKIREVYKDDLAKANKPTEKAAVAAALLTAADGVGQDDASRFVLITAARDLAIDADDAPLAMKAVSALVARFQPDGPTNTKDQIERGNASWKEAEAAPADKRLGLRIQAAEWYLRAKAAAAGVDATLIAKRLAELSEPKAEPKAESKQSDARKTYVATYTAGNPRRRFIDVILASSVEEAKQDVRKRYHRAKFWRVEEVTTRYVDVGGEHH